VESPKEETNPAEALWTRAQIGPHAEHEMRGADEFEKERMARMLAAAPGAFGAFQQRAGRLVCTYASPGIEEIFGLTPEAMVADSDRIWQSIHPADAERIRTTSAESARNMAVWDCEYRVFHPSKGEIWVDAHALPAAEPDGRVTFYTFLRDVTERQRLERRIRLRSDALANSLNAFGIVHPGGKIQYVNAAYLKMWGYDRLEEVVGSSTAEHCVDRSVLRELNERVERDGSYVLEFTALRKDGSTFETLMSVQKSIDEDGAPIYLATAIDITERKRVELELRESRAQLVAALEAANTGTWLLDVRENVVWVDDAALIVCGRTREEIGSGNFDDLFSFVHAEDRARIRQELERLIEEGTEALLEFRILRNDGAVRWIGVTGRAERDTSGSPLRVRGAVVDITQRKRAQESQRLEALGTLAGGIAHDFNNILLAIAANTSLALAELPRAHPVQEHLEEIQRAGTRASQLVQRIVTFSRPEPQQLSALQLRPVAEEALKLLRATVPATVEIRTEFPDSLPAVRADSTHIHQLIVNLVTNAVHAVAPRGGVIVLRLEAERITRELSASVAGLRPGRYVRLTVTDNGHGMDRATVERIFDPFFTTKPAGQGTGLGLSVVYGIMKSYEGEVTVYSEPDKGSVFRLYFPALKTPGAAPPVKAPEIPVGRGQHVLYVDDERPLVRATARLLRRLGYVVTGFTDPILALEAFRARPHEFDVVVTDLAMPAMSGFDFAREVLKVRGSVPVLMTSGYVRPEDHETALAIGVRGLISKPESMTELGHVLGRLFESA